MTISPNGWFIVVAAHPPQPPVAIVPPAAEAQQAQGQQAQGHLGQAQEALEPSTFENDYLSYCKKNNEATNVYGIAKMACDMGLKEVTILTRAVRQYINQERKILKDINPQFKALRHEKKNGCNERRC